MSQTQVGFHDAHVTVTAAPPPTTARTAQPPWSGPAIGRVYEPPSAADLQRDRDQAEQRRRASMRPADKSVAAVQTALDAIVAERAAAAARLTARQEAVTALQDGRYHPPGDCLTALNALELAQLDAAQFERMEAGMRVSLEVAQQDEAEQMARLAERAKDAAQTVARFQTFIERDYPKHAAAIGKGLALEREAEQAMQVLRSAAAHLGHETPAPLPRVPNGTLTEAFRFRACLPGTDVRPVAV